MSTSEPDFFPEDDDELQGQVRSLTQYEDVSDEFPESELKTQVKLAKQRIFNEYDTTEWYNDTGVTQALLYLTAILSKCAVENYSIERWSVDGQSFYANLEGTESAQIKMWTEAYESGIDESEVPDASEVGPALSSNYGWA